MLDPGVQQLQDNDETLEDAVVSQVARHLWPGVRQGRRGQVTQMILVQTGFTFSLTTTDPVNHPLLHPDLLALHAAVMGVARAAGASGMPDMGD